MKIEFIDDISDSGRFPHADPNQLIRIYDFDNTQAQLLKEKIQSEIVENKKQIDLSGLEFVQAVNCNLRLQISDFDRGIAIINNDTFVCNLTIEKYKEMIFLIEPFCSKEAEGYQWLYDLDTPIDFLFSPGGTW
ncbi:hypothetical protein [Parasegetibacter sp. NRK P23]|uniref:hypothetical protein n=1 Tax=Parasegetibacter sp. NRK P23 TaxID=2942999 RepID=UPI002042DA8D|nr:hypothetical protein [Parasegetibacter sp. NRK P23]MCM5530306.1 hypothetical protein [Parasegetibacter sp. NRK P23]